MHLIYLPGLGACWLRVAMTGGPFQLLLHFLLHAGIHAANAAKWGGQHVLEKLGINSELFRVYAHGDEPRIGPRIGTGEWV